MKHRERECLRQLDGALAVSLISIFTPRAIARSSPPLVSQRVLDGTRRGSCDRWQLQERVV